MSNYNHDEAALLRIRELEAALAQRTAERDAMQRRAEAAEADWQSLEAELTRLRAAGPQIEAREAASSAGAALGATLEYPIGVTGPSVPGVLIGAVGPKADRQK